MTVNTVDYLANAVINTSRGPTPVIWGACPVLDILEDPGKGMYFFDDFLCSGQAVMSSIYKNSVGRWATYAAAGSLIDDGALEGGVITIKSGTDLDQTTLFGAAGSFRMLTTSTLALNGKLWFETRVARTSVATDHMEAFVGLADTQLGSSITAVNTLFSGTDDTLATAANLIGFHARGDTTPGDWDFVYCLAGGTVIRHASVAALLAGQLPTALTPTASTFYKLGFLFDPNAAPKTIVTAGDLQTAGQTARPLITIFVNGIPCATFLTTLNLAATASHAFPTGFMGPIIGTAMHATPATLQVDWIRVAQLANS